MAPPQRFWAKETVQKGHQLIWRGKGPDDRRFQVTDISVAFLRNEGGGEVKMTFADRVSSLGYRPVDEAKLNVIVRTKGARRFTRGALIFPSDVQITTARSLRSATRCQATSCGHHVLIRC
jgi:hypothetical protein